MLGNFSEARINFHTCKAHFVFLFFIFFCNCLIVFVIITSGWVVLFRFYAFQLLSFVLFLVFTYAFLFLRFFSFFDHPQQCCNLSRPRNVASCHFFLSIARFTPNNERIYLAVVCERFNATSYLFIAFAVKSDITLQLKHKQNLHAICCCCELSAVSESVRNAFAVGNCV